MNTQMRRAAVAVAAGAMAVSLAACGSAKESGGGSDSSASSAKKGDAIKVGLLLPENQTARYEKFDKPLIEKKEISFGGYFRPDYRSLIDHVIVTPGMKGQVTDVRVFQAGVARVASDHYPVVVKVKSDRVK